MSTVPDVLIRRLLLAAISGLLAYPVVRLEALADLFARESLPSLLSLQGAGFAVFVLLPMTSHSSFRFARIVFLTFGSIVAYYAALSMPARVEIDWLGVPGPLVVSGVTGAMLVAILAWLVVPLQVTIRYWSLSLIAGIVGGLLSFHTLAMCDWWQGCVPSWRALPFSSGWIAWQMLVCLALNAGSVGGPVPLGYRKASALRG